MNNDEFDEVCNLLGFKQIKSDQEKKLKEISILAKKRSSKRSRAAREAWKTRRKRYGRNGLKYK